MNVPFCDNPRCPLNKIAVRPDVRHISLAKPVDILGRVSLEPDDKMLEPLEFQVKIVLRHGHYSEAGRRVVSLCDTCAAAAGLVSSGRGGVLEIKERRASVGRTCAAVAEDLERRYMMELHGLGGLCDKLEVAILKEKAAVGPGQGEKKQ